MGLEPADSLLTLSGLYLELGGRPILQGLDLRIRPGEIHGLLGANGSGKTSLAYAIMGCEGYRPSAGSIRLGGRPIEDLPMFERARLGITLAWQDPARFEGLSLRDDLNVGARSADWRDCLRQVGLDPLECAERAVDRTLSGGERKRVELAAVLAMQPRLAILDDPIHLCFGLLASLQTQKIRLDLMLEPDAQATLWSHCLFATDQAAQHAMQGEIRLGPGALLRYQEAHYHGPAGEIQVIPRATVILERGARYLADFTLLTGRVGRLDLDQRVQVGEEAATELVSRVLTDSE